MRRFLAAVAVALTAACTDGPVGPAPSGGPIMDTSPQGCVTEGTCPLDPIIVIGDPGSGSGGGGGGGAGGGGGEDGGDGPGCELMEGGDPTLQGCPGGGGGGIGEPGTPPSPETEHWNDYIPPQDTVPNCTVTQTATWAKAYCRASAPTGARLDSINAALNRIEQRGPECAAIAAEGRRLLGQSRLQVFAPISGDAGGWGNATIGVLIADYWVDAYASTISGDNRNLEHTLSHEIDHALGRDHIDGAGYETPNSRTCSGLSGTSP